MWTGTIDRLGYGRFGGKLAHRFAWMFANGPIPAGSSILHSCDNRWCVNPRHLRPGTHLDNMKDMAVRGRGVAHSGEACGASKLKLAQVTEIRQRRTSGETLKSIAAAFGIHWSTVARISQGETWASA